MTATHPDRRQGLTARGFASSMQWAISLPINATPCFGKPARRLRPWTTVTTLRGVTVVDLTVRRLERLEKEQHETNKRLGRVEDVLGKVVDVLEVHSRHFERMEDALIGISQRVDRLTNAIARSRTRDLARIDEHERRIRTLERGNHRRPSKP